MSNLLENIESYFAKPDVVQFLDRYDRLICSKPKSHYFNFFGINFSGQHIRTVKFYAHIFEELSAKELLEFVPIAEHYNMFSELRTKSREFRADHVGTILELKFTHEGQNPTYGFYHNLKLCQESFDLMGFPTDLPESMLGSCSALAVNYEYTETSVLIKKYYQFNDTFSKRYFAKRFGLPFLEHASFVELADSDGFKKIHYCFGARVFDVWDEILDTFPSDQVQLIKDMNDKYGLVNITFAQYENQPTRAIYFFDQGSNCNPKVAKLCSSKYIYSNTIRKVLLKV